MDERILTEQDAIELVLYLASAAELALIEPELYGSFRLVDGASRLLSLLADRTSTGRAHLYAKFREEIDRDKLLMMWDRDAYLAFVQRLPRELVDELGGSARGSNGQ